jgi:hypothetical protein
MLHLKRAEPFADVWFPANRWLRWGRALRLAGYDRETGEAYYTETRVRPWWWNLSYQVGMCIKLFFQLWRKRWEPEWNPIDAKTAWKVAYGVWFKD